MLIENGLQRKGLQNVQAVLILMIFLLVGINIVITLMSKPSGEVVISDDVAFQLKLNERLGQVAIEALRLSREGSHLEAAKMLAGVASARRILLPSSDDVVCPNVTERMALNELRYIGKDEEYRVFLKALYANASTIDLIQPTSQPKNENGGGEKK